MGAQRHRSRPPTRLPRQDSSTSTCKASWAERRGRNPYEHSPCPLRRLARARSSPRPARCGHAPKESTTAALAAAQLRDEHPPGRQRPIATVLQLMGQLVEQPVNAVLLDLGRGGLVDARRTVVTAHRDPCPPQGISAEDLVSQRMEPTPGNRPWPPGTAHAARHEPGPAWTRRGGSLPPSHPLPEVIGYRTPRTGNTNRRVAGPGRVPPVPAAHSLHVPRPIRRGVHHGCTFRIFTASMAFTRIRRARHSHAPRRRAAE
jgi:hypothetical protein